jgi:uncharacterized protein
MMNEQQGIAAVPHGDRIELLDGLRGFALLGILLANIDVFSGWVFLDQAQALALAGESAVRWTELFTKAVIDGKFYTLFSLMFGVGFTLQLDRLNKRGAAGAVIFRRRMLVMLMIGLLHMSMIWEGDILTLYAALGLLLPLFMPMNDRKLLMWAVGLILLPLVLAPAFDVMNIRLGKPFFMASGAVTQWISGNPNAHDLQLLQSTSWRDFFAIQLSGLPFRLGYLLITWRIPKVLGIMLLGMVVGRRLIAGTLLDDRRLLIRTFWLGLLIGVPFSVAYALTEGAAQDHWSSILGTVPLALAYAAGFVLLWPKARGLLRHLVPVGRMALTNYLMHSLVGLLLMGPFLGWAGRMQPWQFYALALGIYGFQLVFSRVWLASHAQGPMEKLWRYGTYRNLH